MQHQQPQLTVRRPATACAAAVAVAATVGRRRAEVQADLWAELQADFWPRAGPRPAATASARRCVVWAAQHDCRRRQPIDGVEVQHDAAGH
eukprot:236966-Chlamydomonas_euryale.AAC.1